MYRAVVAPNKETDISVRKFTQLPKPIDMHVLVDNLARAGRNHPTEGDPTAIIIVWLTIGGNISYHSDSDRFSGLWQIWAEKA